MRLFKKKVNVQKEVIAKYTVTRDEFWELMEPFVLEKTGLTTGDDWTHLSVTYPRDGSVQFNFQVLRKFDEVAK